MSAPGMSPTSQPQMSMASQQPGEMYMAGVQMNGGMGSEYQGGSAVGANVQSQVITVTKCVEGNNII